MASIRQVQSAFALRPSVENLAEGVRLSPEEPLAIGFNAVEFRYRRQKRLLDIPSLGISPGERVALVGENGAGKSTLLKLIARLYDPTVGSIRIGREDLSRIDLKSLRRSVCYVQRNSAFFEGTIASNLRFVRPAATPDEIDEVLEAVGLTAMIRSSRQGVDERIGPGGCQLSAGEQQRLAIARVLLQRPRILMLDEATSCLDPSSEAMIFDHLGRRLNAALIVVSHRSSTIQSFQRIVTLAHGKIASDTHSDSSLIREASKPRAVIQQTSIRKDSTGRQPISTA